MYQPLIKFHPYPAIITQVLIIFAVENFRMGGQLFGVVRKIRHYVRCALSLYCK